MDNTHNTQGNTNNHGLENESLHSRDVNSHEIFKNNVLTSQFLKDYTGTNQGTVLRLNRRTVP